MNRHATPQFLQWAGSAQFNLHPSVALNVSENQTAAQGGTFRSIIHTNYKRLATRIRAGKWFAVKGHVASQ